MQVLYPSFEEAFALVFSDLFPIENILIGKTKPFPSYKVRRKANEKTYLIEHVLSGKGEFRVQGKTQEIHAGNTFLIDKSAPHDFCSDKNQPLEKIWIAFSSDYIEKMLNSYRISTGIYTADVKNEFLRLYGVAKLEMPPQDKYFEIANLLQTIVLKLAQSAHEKTETNLSAIKSALLACIYTKKTLTNVANELFMSKSNLIRTFKMQTGETPYQFLLNQKINAAKTMLSTSTMQIKSIAEFLCWTDEHYFSFIFKQKTGLTPSKYRDLHAFNS